MSTAIVNHLLHSTEKISGDVMSTPHRTFLWTAVVMRKKRKGGRGRQRGAKMMRNTRLTILRVMSHSLRTLMVRMPSLSIV